MGFLHHRHPTQEQLAQVAGLAGTPVSPQAIHQRFTPALAEFLQHLLQQAFQHRVSSDRALAGIVQRFTEVDVLDSTQVKLPAELRERYPGCGGSCGSGQAALKLQWRWDLRRGAFTAQKLETGRQNDLATALQEAPMPRGSLRISDLGYFDTEVFAQIGQQGSYWLSRLQCSVKVFNLQGEELRVSRWLKRQRQPVVDAPILLGQERRLPCRLIAWRVPPRVARMRRERLLTQAKRKRQGGPPSAERLALCAWTLLVTNVPVTLLSDEEALVLYRARWQIELLFKRWKSYGQIAEQTQESAIMHMVRLWARLLGVLLVHWLTLASIWGDRTKSLAKADQALRRVGLLLASVSVQGPALQQVVQRICASMQAIARFNKKKKPSTFELLEQPKSIWKLLT